MVEFFVEGGFAMYPVLAVGLVLLASAGAYAMDREPVRLRLVTVLSVTLVALSIQGALVDMAKVLWFVSGDKLGDDALRFRVLLEGAKESTRPAVLGLGLLILSLVLVSIGTYRSVRRELAALRGGV